MEGAVSETTVAEVIAGLADLEVPKMRAIVEKQGDDHGVNLSKLRTTGQRLKTQQDLARELWATGDTAGRLLALLICRSKKFGREELDLMLRQSRAQGAGLAGALCCQKESPRRRVTSGLVADAARDAG